MYAALTIGAIINVLILVVLGGVTVYKFVAPKPVEIQAPPPLKPLDPPTVKYNQQKSKDREKSSQRPRQQQIRARSVTQINTPDIDLNISDVAPSVGVGGGVGDGLGSGLGLSGGGMRMGVSAVDFFGIKSKGERIVVIVDIASSMLEQQRGDIPGFTRVKAKVDEVIDSLNSATLFNMMVFSQGLDVMSGDLVLANGENKARARKFFEPYWKANGGFIASDARRSVFLRNYEPQFNEDFQPLHGRSRMDMALASAFEQKADAIFMITDGTPNIWRARNAAEQKEYDELLATYEEGRANATQAERDRYDRQLEEMRRQRRAQQGGTAEENRRRAERGLGERIQERIPPPEAPWGGSPPAKDKRVSLEEFLAFIDQKGEVHYGKRRSDLPTLNIIGYSIPKRGETAEFLNDMRRRFPNGQFKFFGEFKENVRSVQRGSFDKQLLERMLNGSS
ncbi:MAG: hypothetical protein ACPGN3_17550 [Opitutales bacterium]